MITARLDGDRLIELRLTRLGDDVQRGRIVTTVHSLTDRLRDLVIAREPERTGELRSETRSSFSDRATVIAGRVRIRGRREAAKAAALEYGAHGDAHVKAYQRRGGEMVEAYTRRVNIPAHRFMRDSLAAMQAEIDAELQRAVAEAVAEANA